MWICGLSSADVSCASRSDTSSNDPGLAGSIVVGDRLIPNIQSNPSGATASGL